MDAGREVVVYITSWCGSCKGVMRFLDERSIAYTTVDIDEDDGGAERVMALNGGNRSVPTIVVDGDHALTEPSRREMEAAFEAGS